MEAEMEGLPNSIDNPAPSKKYICLIKNLDRMQTSILFQLRSGHIRLNLHLFHIHKVESPSCPHCQGITVELIKDFLLVCPQYAWEQHDLRVKLHRNANSISFLLSNPMATLPLLKFVHATGHFKAIFGKDTSEHIQTNSKKKAEIHLVTEQLETALINAANASTN
jgi:hypothetical protein